MGFTTSPTSPTAGRTSFQSTKLVQEKGQATVGKEVNESMEETASGQNSGGYAGDKTAEVTRKILSAEQLTIEGTATQGKIKELTGHLNQAAGANTSLQGIAANFHTRVTAAQKGDAQDQNFPDFCKNMLGQVENILNKKGFDGRSLFGGTATRSDAVKLSDAATPGATDVPNASYDAYFKGHDSTHHATVHGEGVDYGFSALDPGARDLIFWLKSGAVTMPDGDPSSPNGQRLKGMQDGLHKAIASLSNTQKVVGEQLGKIERLSQTNEDELADNKTTFSELTDADLLEQLTRSAEARLMQQLMMHMQSAKTKDFQDLLSKI